MIAITWTKMFRVLAWILFFLIILVIILLTANPLSYVYKESNYQEFYFEGDYVVFWEQITIKNRSSQSFNFYLSADVSKDMGLVAKKTAIACEEDSLDKARFFIGGNTIQGYNVYFKVLRGDKDSKKDRLPPRKMGIEILE